LKKKKKKTQESQGRCAKLICIDNYLIKVFTTLSDLIWGTKGIKLYTSVEAQPISTKKTA